MKKFLLIGLLVAALGVFGCAKEAEASGDWNPCESRMAGIFNECVEHPEREPNREVFDMGTYLHLILWEADGGNWEIGNWNTWEIQRGEVTSLVGVKIYLNRFFWQKKGE